MKKALAAGDSEIARIHAQSAIRKQNERVNLLRLASRIDSVASRVQTAVTMRSVSQNMLGVVKGMDVAMKTMDLEKIQKVMDKFEEQFEDLDVAVGAYEGATSSATAVGTPQEDVERLLNEVADQNGLELGQKMDVEVPKGQIKVSEAEEEGLESRLRALRG